MVVSRNDPIESFLNSIQVFKNPIELNFQKAVKSFNNCFNGVVKNGNFSGSVKMSGRNVVIGGGGGDDWEKGKFPIKLFIGIIAEKCGSDDHSNFRFSCDWVDKVKISTSKKGLKECRLKGEKKGVRIRKMSNNDHSSYDGEIKPKELKVKAEKKDLSFEFLKRFIFDRLSNFPKFDASVQDHDCRNAGCEEALALQVNGFEHFKAIFRIFGGEKEFEHGFSRNLNFARVGGVPKSTAGLPPVKDVEDEGATSIPLSNDERLKSTLLTVSLTELIELLPQVRRPSDEDHPDKTKLFSVQDFFRYTEAEGKRLFHELDRDGDGKITLEDLEIAMRKRKLPKRYAHEFMRRTKSHFFSKSFGWKQFLSLMEEKEPTIIRAYTSLRLSNSKTLQKGEILASLENAGHRINEDNAIAIMHFLNADTNGSMSYGNFRDLMVLLPSDQLQEDPRIKSEAAVELRAQNVLKSALAGGISCALSAALMHPVDTIKTWVQASTTLTFPQVLSKLPQYGVRALYKGSIPAILGQFSSHGLRTGICETSKLVLLNVAPTLPGMQVESVASFCGTFLGTAMRIPCEVLKQRLQASLFDNVGEAIVGTWQQDGLGGFFRGTGATLCREIPFYVAGMGLYAESKKAVQKLIGRELQPWETVVVGALSGGLTAVMTTPIDVIKTRMMTVPQGQKATLSIIVLSILRHEGPLGLFKGAVPRFFWVAPLGAMNFAGYELLRKAMD